MYRYVWYMTVCTCTCVRLLYTYYHTFCSFVDNIFASYKIKHTLPTRYSQEQAEAFTNTFDEGVAVTNLSCIFLKENTFEFLHCLLRL